MSRRLVVAIDGPAGSGKSTIARMLAHELGYRYVDTGAMYRALTWKALKEKIPVDSAEGLAGLARRLRMRFPQKEGTVSVLVDGEDVTHRIRTEKVSRLTSQISAIQGVRKVLRKRQRTMGRRGGVVMEGRDIGTAVFPDADVKFYLDASPIERAKRRHQQLAAHGRRASLSSIAKAIRQRDHNDKSRGISPLHAASDAVVLDSTMMSQHDVVQVMLGHIKGLGR